MSGLVDFHIGDTVVRRGPSGVARIPGDIAHYAEVAGDKPALNLDVFTPARPEYD